MTPYEQLLASALDGVAPPSLEDLPAASARLVARHQSAALREFNACHLPAGDSDGGQFGANADPRCAGENPGSLYHGPARPPRGAAHRQRQQRQQTASVQMRALDAMAAEGGRSAVHQQVFGKMPAEVREGLHRWSEGDPRQPREALVVLDPATGAKLPIPLSGVDVEDLFENVVSGAYGLSAFLSRADEPAVSSDEYDARTREAWREGYLLGNARGVPGWPAMLRAGILIHTHPTSRTFSQPDVKAATMTGGLPIGVLGRDGSEYSLQVFNSYNALQAFGDLNDVLRAASQITTAVVTGRAYHPGEAWRGREDAETILRARGHDVQEAHETAYGLFVTGVFEALRESGDVAYDEKLSAAQRRLRHAHFGADGAADIVAAGRWAAQQGRGRAVAGRQTIGVAEVVRHLLDRRQRRPGAGLAGGVTEAAARLTEFNRCHEPAGTPDRTGDGRGEGGRFAHSDNERCADGSGGDGDAQPKAKTKVAPPTSLTPSATPPPVTPGGMWMSGKNASFDPAVAAQVFGADLDPTEVAQTMARYMSEPMRLRIATEVTKEGPSVVLWGDSTTSKTYYRRALTRNAMTGELIAHHDHFANDGPPQQGAALMQGQLELYERLGVSAIATTANISTGAYAWARYGFTAEDPAMFAATVQQRLSVTPDRTSVAGLMAASSSKAQLSGVQIQALAPYLPTIEQALANPDPTTPWKVADLRVEGTAAELQPLVAAFKVRSNSVFSLSVSQATKWNAALDADLQRGVFNLGRVLLTGTTWSARAGLQDASTLARLHTYMQRAQSSLSAPAPAPSLWQRTKRLFVTEAALQEFNACHLPAGNSDGGQFGRNDDPHCAGANPGSVYYGPARPSVRRKARKVSPSNGTAARAYTSRDNLAGVDTDARTEQEIARLFPGWTAERLAHAMTQYLDQPVKVSFDSYDDNISIKIKSVAEVGGTPELAITRALSKTAAYHASFRNHGAADAGKKLMRAQLELYEQLGITKVDLGANVSTGAYAWARYGFVPREQSLNPFSALNPVVDVQRRFRALSRIVPALQAYEPTLLRATGPELPAEWTNARHTAGAPDPEAVWRVSDLRITGKPAEIKVLAEAMLTTSAVGREWRRAYWSLSDTDAARWDQTIKAEAAQGVFNLGRVLLTGGAWVGRLDLTNAKARERLKAYVGDWTRKTAEAALQEFNACHLPAGDSDGGQFGANADPRCAGENPGSLYHGPARPPRGKARTRDLQRRAKRMLRATPDAFQTLPKVPPQARLAAPSAGDSRAYVERNNVRSLAANEFVGTVGDIFPGWNAAMLAHHFTKYLDRDMLVSVSVNGPALTIEMTGEGVRIRRLLHKNSAYHASFTNAGPADLGKKLMRAQLELYERLGITEVKVGANISTGAYAWARYGFVSQHSYDFDGLVERRLRQYADWSPVWRRYRIAIEAQIAAAPPQAVDRAATTWAVSDLRIVGEPAEVKALADSLLTTGAIGRRMVGSWSLTPKAKRRWNATIRAEARRGEVNIGRALLTGGGWTGLLQLTDPATRARLKAYVGDWTRKTRPGQQHLF